MGSSPLLKPLVAGGIALALLAGAVSAFWVWSARRVEDEIVRWADRERQAGATVQWESLAIDGFPLRLNARLAKVTYAVTTRVPPYSATAPALTGTAWVWNWNDWQIAAPEGAKVTVPADQARPAIEASAARLTGSVNVGLIGGAAIAVTAHGVASGDFRVEIADATLTLPAAQPGSHLDTDGTLAVRLQRLDLPGTVPTLGRTIDTLSLRATLKGALPPGPIAPALARWRDDGGTLELEDAHLAWGQLQALASGTIALDQNLQPIGSLKATVVGPDALADAMVESGTLKPNDGTLAKIAIGLMARPGPDGTPRVTLPARLQNGHLYLGPARLLAIPRIAW